MLVGISQHYYKGNHSQAAGHSDIACKVGTAGQQTQKVIDPDEKEYSKNKRQKFPGLVSQVRLSHLVTYKYYDRLQCILKTAWCGHRTIVLILLGGSGHQPKQQR